MRTYICEVCNKRAVIKKRKCWLCFLKSVEQPVKPVKRIKKQVELIKIEENTKENKQNKVITSTHSPTNLIDCCYGWLDDGERNKWQKIKKTQTLTLD